MIGNSHARHPVRTPMWIAKGRPEPIVAKTTQEMLAEMIGTTRSRVSHFMDKFREIGFIDHNGHLEERILRAE